MATLIESLALEDNEKGVFAELTQQESEITEEVHPTESRITPNQRYESWQMPCAIQTGSAKVS